MVVPEVCVFHVAPPSVVARMVPLLPAAQPSLGVANATAKRASVVPDVCVFHAVPAPGEGCALDVPPPELEPQAPAISVRVRPTGMSAGPRSLKMRRRADGLKVRVAGCSMLSPHVKAPRRAPCRRANRAGHECQLHGGACRRIARPCTNCPYLTCPARHRGLQTRAGAHGSGARIACCQAALLRLHTGGPRPGDRAKSHPRAVGRRSLAAGTQR